MQIQSFDSPTELRLDRMADELSVIAHANAELPGAGTLCHAVGLAEHLLRTVAVYLGAYGTDADQRAYLWELRQFVRLYDRIEEERS